MRFRFSTAIKAIIVHDGCKGRLYNEPNDITTYWGNLQKNDKVCWRCGEAPPKTMLIIRDLLK